jgi:hypothetical protein
LFLLALTGAVDEGGSPSSGITSSCCVEVLVPHDLGQYPQANGQVYGGAETSERDPMPVEDCGNPLILVGGLAKVHGYADMLESNGA